MRVQLLLAIALSVSSGAGLAQATPVPTAGSGAGPVAAKPICRRETPTGSNMPKKTCHTAEEWKQIDNPNAERRRQMAASVKPNP